MSTIRKTPYIESAVALLSGEQKSALLTALNTATPVTTQSSFKSFTEGINAVVFTFPNNEIKTGILINVDDLQLFIGYHTSEQTLELIKLDDSDETWEKVDEYLDINELRRILVDSGNVEITPNPTDEATAELTKIDINGTVYSLGGGTEVEGNPTASDTADLTKITIDTTTYGINGINVLTTAPTEANTGGQLKVVVLSSEPATKYDGYLYIITE